MCLYMHMYLFVGIHVYHVCLWVFMCVCVSVSMCVCIYVCVCESVCVSHISFFRR